jgi:hypothetical protein
MELEPLNDARVDALLNGMMLTAKYNREQIGYDDEERFMPVALLLGQHFETTIIPCNWRDEREKYALMGGVSEYAKKHFIRAVVLITDTRWTVPKDVTPILGLPPFEEVGLDIWKSRYSKALNQPPYNGQIKNLPRHCWHEAVMVIMKAPELKGKIPSRFAQYERGPNNTIHWLSPDRSQPKDDRTIHFNLLPDWWD